MRLIDADALIKSLGIGDLPIRLTYEIESAPTVDAVPVKHGKNVGTDYDETDQFICSECGIELQGWYRVERDDYDGEETHHEYRLRYCPHCGARMDEE